MTVYLDLVMLLNFLVDFSLLLGTNRLSGYPPGIWRCGLGAAFGGVYSGICMLPGFRFLGNTFWRLVCLMLMSGISFGLQTSALRRAGVYLLLSMALGGLAVSFGKGAALPLLCCSGILWILCTLGFSQPPGTVRYHQMTLRHAGKSVDVLALYDTGNTLTDPLTGEQVLVISPEVAKRLTGLTDAQLRSPLDTVTQRVLPGLRLIPCRTITGGGMLLGMRIQEAKIGNRITSPVVAFATEELGRGEAYQALTGGLL